MLKSCPFYAIFATLKDWENELMTLQNITGFLFKTQ